MIGKVLANRYEIERKLGEGAMGSVYLARHVKVGRPFAVKVLHPRLLVDPKQVQRFEREAELAGRLHHPNVIGVVDVGEVDELRYMVMDYAEGQDLASLLKEAPMKPARITNLVRQLLEGLYHAHEAGLIHRDLKPENVIVERDAHGEEVPRILDFGVAILREGGASADAEGRLTTNGMVLGTPHYMAPEQAVNDPIDHRIDLFALGIMIYELLSGVLPFDGRGAEVARANLLYAPPKIADRVPHLEVDPLLEAFGRTLMAKNRDARPATAKVAREMLDQIDRDREIAAIDLGVPLEIARGAKVTETVEPLPPPPVKRKKWGLIGGAVAFASLFAIVLSVSMRRDDRAAEALPNLAMPVTMAVTVEQKPDVTEIPVADSMPPPEIEIETPMLARMSPHRVARSHPNAPYDPQAFRAQWQSVGEELYAYIRSHGVNAAVELQNRYTAISFLQAAATQEGRDQARKQLDAIHEKLAAR
ncbi:MAG: serine/threonine-protein kinase [Kofleriaceae bacterium]